MIKEITIVLFPACCSVDIHAQDFAGPDTVSVRPGKLTLKSLLWRPARHCPFPTFIFCHGSYGGGDNTNPVQQASVLGAVFVQKGYIFLMLFRRGVGLSQGQGENSSELMNNAFTEKGHDVRNKIQVQQLETDQLQDMISGLTFLRRQDIIFQSGICTAGDINAIHQVLLCT